MQVVMDAAKKAVQGKLSLQENSFTPDRAAEVLRSLSTQQEDITGAELHSLAQRTAESGGSIDAAQLPLILASLPVAFSELIFSNCFVAASPIPLSFVDDVCFLWKVRTVPFERSMI